MSYVLVYRKKVMLLIEFDHKALRTTSQLSLYLSVAQLKRIQQLNELDELRQQALFRVEITQQQRNKWHAKFIKSKAFRVGDWALLYDSRFKYFKEKLMNR